MNFTKVDGEKFHCHEDGEIMTYDDGEPIPAYICICAAHSVAECCCGGWNVPLPCEDY